MAEMLSPLEPVYQRGAHGNRTAGSSLTLCETHPGSIVQVAAWSGQDAALQAIVGDACGLALDGRSGSGVCSDSYAAFGFAPGRYLVVDQKEGLAERLRERVAVEVGSVTDLSHGRTALRVDGAKAEWVLSKLYPIDFSLDAFPVTAARSTTHHEVFTLIQRSGASKFDLFVYRSFARSFWELLCDCSEEVGYTVE